MPCTIFHKHIVACVAEFRLLLTEFHRTHGRVVPLIEHLRIPICLRAIILVDKRLRRFPSVEVARQIRLTAISHLAVSGTALAKHIEWAAIEALVLILLAKCHELRNELLIEGESCYVPCGVDAEAINAHLYKLAIALHKILSYGIIFGVKIHTVAGNLPPPAARIVPVPAVAIVVIVVVNVVLRILEILEALLILLRSGEVIVIRWQTVVIWYNRSRHRSLVLNVPASGEKRIECSLAEIAGVI